MLLCSAALVCGGCSSDPAKATATPGQTHTSTTTATGSGGAGQGGTSSAGGGNGHGGQGQGGSAHGGGGNAQGGAGGHAAGGQGTGGQQGQGGQGISYVCSINTNWTIVPGGTAVIATGDDDVLGSITPDELTIAFLSPAKGEVRYADRADSVDTFASLETLPAAAGFYAMDRVALSPDGLRIVVVSSDHKKLAQLTRKLRSDAFSGAPDSTAFAAINGSLAVGDSLGDPVLANDDSLLVYSQYSAVSTTTIHVAEHGSPAAAWALTADTFGGKELDASKGKLRRPTSMSADLLTLYFWDEVSAVQRAAWREQVGVPFTQFMDYPQLSHAVPTGNCKKLYFTGKGIASDDILLAFPE